MAAARLKKVSLLRDRVSDWEKYPFTVPVIRALDELELTSQVTYFVGENGSGKSTLLEAIASHVGFSLKGGSRNVRFSTTESTNEIDPLTARLRLSWTRKNGKGFYLRAESFFNQANFVDPVLSYPEATILSFDDGKIRQISYEESLPYHIYSSFLNRKDKYLKELFAELF